MMKGQLKQSVRFCLPACIEWSLWRSGTSSKRRAPRRRLALDEVRSPPFRPALSHWQDAQRGRCSNTAFRGALRETNRAALRDLLFGCSSQGEQWLRDRRSPEPQQAQLVDRSGRSDLAGSLATPATFTRGNGEPDANGLSVGHA